MPYGRYFAYDMAGGILWGAGMVLGGYFLGRQIPNISENIHYVIAVVIFLSLLPPAISLCGPDCPDRRRPFPAFRSPPQQSGTDRAVPWPPHRTVRRAPSFSTSAVSSSGRSLPFHGRAGEHCGGYATPGFAQLEADPTLAWTGRRAESPRATGMSISLKHWHFTHGFRGVLRDLEQRSRTATDFAGSLFERLAARCRLRLLSNTDPIHVAHFEAHYDFVRSFPVRVYSCHVGISKPSPSIYHHALREVDAMPDEAVFIDDCATTCWPRPASASMPFTSRAPPK